MAVLSIDLETYSDQDIRYGVHKYVDTPDFRVLLFAYAFDDEPVDVVDIACGEKLPERVRKALYDPNVTKTAFNANFEFSCLRKYFPDLPIEQWECDSVLALYNSYPSSLALVAKAMHLAEDKQKDTRGKALIQYFCVPCKPTVANGQRTRNLPEHAPEKWAIFKEYNRQDVETERAIRKALIHNCPGTEEHDLWLLDRKINDNGIAVCGELVENAIDMNEKETCRLMEEARSITGLDNPNSVIQLKDWLSSKVANLPQSLDKDSVAELLKGDIPDDVRRLLMIRKDLGKTSIKKYEATINSICRDGRVHDVFQFYGASRTGRWAGRNLQLHNLPRNSLPDLDAARQLVLDGDMDTLSMLYGVPDTLSQLIRTSLVAPKGSRFIVADFSAIEARVLSWLAGEKWRLDVFKQNGDIYCETASRMFNCKVVKHGENGHLRQKGKIAELALGFNGSVGALIKMGADKMGLTENELKDIVQKWRKANPHIVNFWYRLEEMALCCIQGKETPTMEIQYPVKFYMQGKDMRMLLPSGRTLTYLRPSIGKNRFGSDSIEYEGLEQDTKKWGRLETYGGKLAENCIAEGTKVVTGRGFIPIEQIKDNDIIWDGVEWVQHEGLIAKGTHFVVKVNGIFMTEDHEILTERGWIPSGKAQRYYWQTVSLPDGYPTSRKYSKRAKSMGVQMHLRQREGNQIQGLCSEIASCKILRMYDQRTDCPKATNSRHEPSPGLCCVALHETALQRQKPSSLPQLWGTGYNSLREMATQFREFLGRYGGELSTGIGFGQNRQQQRLFSPELSLDNSENQLHESQKVKVHRHSLRENVSKGAIGDDWDRCFNDRVSSGSQMAERVVVRPAGLQKRVYDIRNCGPGHRFAVWDEEYGACRIVSNCTQAIARDCLACAMMRLDKAGYKIVMHVHDEVIIESPIGEGSLEDVISIMKENVSWNQGLPLDAAGFESMYYMKD